MTDKRKKAPPPQPVSQHTRSMRRIERMMAWSGVLVWYGGCTFIVLLLIVGGLGITWLEWAIAPVATVMAVGGAGLVLSWIFLAFEQVIGTVEGIARVVQRRSGKRKRGSDE